jgi:hypothetical protein
MVRTPAGRRNRRDKMCERHLASLENAYYERGQAPAQKTFRMEPGTYTKKVKEKNCFRYFQY